MLWGRPLTEFMAINSADSSDWSVFSPETSPVLNVSESRISLYRMGSSLARDLINSHACSGVHVLDALSTSSRYIFKISEADCSIISCTASVKMLATTLKRPLLTCSWESLHSSFVEPRIPSPSDGLQDPRCKYQAPQDLLSAWMV
jgi:hypothetical protein